MINVYLFNKFDYLKVGGLAEDYPGSWVTDWELFLKLKLSNIELIRSYKTHFYHFVSLSTHSPEVTLKRQQSERNGHEYAKYKWGKYIQHNPKNNLKFIS